MIEGNIIPGRFCEKCGEPLHAVRMDVLSVEVICMNCDNQPMIDYSECPFVGDKGAEQ